MKVQRIDSNEVIQNKRLLKTFDSISTRAKKNPGDIIETWIRKSEYVLVAQEKHRVVGFCTYRILPEIKTIYIISIIIDPEFQRRGIAKKFLSKLVRSCIFDLHNLLFSIKIITNKNFYFILRTQNPTVYSALSKRFTIYPNIINRSQDSQILNFACKLTKKLWPGTVFDPKDFILVNAHRKIPRIGLKYKDVQWSGNLKIDREFQKILKFSSKKRCIHSLLVICETSLFKLK